MPEALSYTETAPLGIPTDIFNQEVASLIVHGARQGGRWVVAAVIHRGEEQGAPAEKIGEIHIEQATNPDAVYETALAWVQGYCPGHDMKALAARCFNDHYGPGERPYFSLGQILVVHPAESGGKHGTIEHPS